MFKSIWNTLCRVADAVWNFLFAAKTAPVTESVKPVEPVTPEVPVTEESLDVTEGLDAVDGVRAMFALLNTQMRAA